MRTLATEKWTLLFVLALLAMRLASTPTAAAAFVILAAYAFVGPRQTVHSLLLCWFFVMVGPAFSPTVPAASMLRFLVIFAAAAATLSRCQSRQLKVTIFTVATSFMGLFIFLHSLIISAEPVISSLKISSWVVAMLTSTSAWSGMSSEMRERTARDVYALLLGILLASLMLLRNPNAYMIGGSFLFRGVMGHSQSFGPTMTLLGVWTVTRLLMKPSYGGLLISLATFYVVFQTNSRTALVAWVLGMVLSLILVQTLSKTRKNYILSTLRSPKIGLAVLGGLLGMLFYAPQVAELGAEFLRKGTESQTLIAAYDQSRGGLISTMMENFEEHPMTGIGFGIASDPENMIVTRVQGIPISAIVEKGVLPVAVLEELGWPGAILVMAWLFLMLRNCLSDALTPMALVLTILALNMGEATLFSVGGMGLLSIILVGWAISARQYQRH